MESLLKKRQRRCGAVNHRRGQGLLVCTLVFAASAVFTAKQEQAKMPDAAAGKSSSGDESATAEIEELIAKYAAAVSAEPVNLNLASQVWANSQDVSIIFPLGEVQGWEHVKRDFYENFFEALFSERKLTMRDVRIHAYGDSAWAEFSWHFTAKLRKDGTIKNSDGYETQIYRAAGPHKWVLVHVHYSAVVPPPSGAAPKP